MAFKRPEEVGSINLRALVWRGLAIVGTGVGFRVVKVGPLGL